MYQSFLHVIAFLSSPGTKQGQHEAWTLLKHHETHTDNTLHRKRSACHKHRAIPPKVEENE